MSTRDNLRPRTDRSLPHGKGSGPVRFHYHYFPNEGFHVLALKLILAFPILPGHGHPSSPFEIIISSGGRRSSRTSSAIFKARPRALPRTLPFLPRNTRTVLIDGTRINRSARAQDWLERLFYGGDLQIDIHFLPIRLQDDFGGLIFHARAEVISLPLTLPKPRHVLIPLRRGRYNGSEGVGGRSSPGRVPNDSTNERLLSDPKRESDCNGRRPIPRRSIPYPPS
jgi:hypothetical protein